MIPLPPTVPRQISDISIWVSIFFLTRYRIYDILLDIEMSRRSPGIGSADFPAAARFLADLAGVQLSQREASEHHAEAGGR
jgi:hypothetical protein